MTETFRQAQVLLTHPLSHAVLALALVVVSIFALMRTYFKTSRRAPMFFVGGSVVALVFTGVQLMLVERTELPHTWLLGRDVPVYLLLDLTLAFAVLGVIELMARRQWQGYTNLMLAAGSLALTAGILKYAYAWSVTSVSIIVFLTLLLTGIFVALAAFYSRKWAPPASQRLFSA